MESQPQNPEFLINPENFHPCILAIIAGESKPKVPDQTIPLGTKLMLESLLHQRIWKLF